MPEAMPHVERQDGILQADETISTAQDIVTGKPALERFEPSQYEELCRRENTLRVRIRRTQDAINEQTKKIDAGHQWEKIQDPKSSKKKMMEKLDSCEIGMLKSHRELLRTKLTKDRLEHLEVKRQLRDANRSIKHYEKLERSIMLEKARLAKNGDQWITRLRQDLYKHSQNGHKEELEKAKQLADSSPLEVVDILMHVLEDVSRARFEILYVNRELRIRVAKSIFGSDKEYIRTTPTSAPVLY